VYNCIKVAKMDVAPDSFYEWKNCIEKKCGLPLTPEFAVTRVAALRDIQNEHTREFTVLYGDAYRLKVISWFEQSMMHTQ
jgi:hypothetical protein